MIKILMHWSLLLPMSTMLNNNNGLAENNKAFFSKPAVETMADDGKVEPAHMF